jgi:hypothetical protein
MLNSGLEDWLSCVVPCAGTLAFHIPHVPMHSRTHCVEHVCTVPGQRSLISTRYGLATAESAVLH